MENGGQQQQNKIIDDLQNKKTTTNGTKIFTFENIIEVFSQSRIYCCIAIADKKTREKLTKKCSENGMIATRYNLQLMLSKIECNIL